MGRAWFEGVPVAAQTFGSADEILGDRLGARLSTICFEGPEDLLNRTDVAQPAIYVTSVACYHALFSDVNRSTLAATAGLSLGEYTALHLAGVFSFADGLELVTLRGRAMQDAAEASSGGMLALIGADEAQADEVCAKAAGSDVLVPANFNAPGQIVLSGHASACERGEAVAAEMGLRATRLSVAGAFHSPLMAPAADRLQEALEGVSWSEPACPVLSNVTARPHEAEGGQPMAASIGKRLVEQLTHPVRWAESCQWLVERGVGEYHELAPGRVLAGLMRRIDRQTKVQSHDKPED